MKKNVEEKRKKDIVINIDSEKNDDEIEGEMNGNDKLMGKKIRKWETRRKR